MRDFETTDLKDTIDHEKMLFDSCFGELCMEEKRTPEKIDACISSINHLSNQLKYLKHFLKG